jgi:hypothetical protein
MLKVKLEPIDVELALNTASKRGYTNRPAVYKVDIKELMDMNDL